MNKIIYLGIAVGVIVIGLLSSIFIVDEREKALVLQFGRVAQVKETPGLGFKIPIVQEVVKYDDRIISINMAAFEVTPLDDRRLIVDAFARYRISDVERFRQATGAGGVQALAVANTRLESILSAETREVLGSVLSNDILSEDRDALMLRIRNAAIPEAAELGLAVIDVRLKRTDLPPQNLEATFRRMVAEREREAEDERARGREAAQRVRALADRTVVELESDAGRQARIIEGEADARRNAIFAEAFNEDTEFFEFYRSLEAYRQALQSNNTRMVMSPDHEFFDYLRSPSGRSATAVISGLSEDGATTGSVVIDGDDADTEGTTSGDDSADADVTVPEDETAETADIETN